MHYIHRTILFSRFAPIIIGMGVLLSGCDSDGLSPYQRKVAETQTKIRTGHKTEITAEEYVCFCASLPPDELVRLAAEQKQKYSDGEKLLVQEIWALGNVARVVAFNHYLTCPPPVEFEEFRNSVTAFVAKDNKAVEKILEDNFVLAENILESMKYNLPERSRDPLGKLAQQPVESAPTNLLDVLVGDLAAAIDNQDQDKISEGTRKAALYLGYKGEDIAALKPGSILLAAKDRQNQEQQTNRLTRNMDEKLSEPVLQFTRDYLAHKLDSAIASLANMETSYTDGIYASAAGVRAERNDRSSNVAQSVPSPTIVFPSPPSR